jgi:hypothetical protein
MIASSVHYMPLTFDVYCTTLPAESGGPRGQEAEHERDTGTRIHIGVCDTKPGVRWVSGPPARDPALCVLSRCGTSANAESVFTCLLPACMLHLRTPY